MRRREDPPANDNNFVANKTAAKPVPRLPLQGGPPLDGSDRRLAGTAVGIAGRSVPGGHVTWVVPGCPVWMVWARRRRAFSDLGRCEVLQRG